MNLNSKRKLFLFASSFILLVFTFFACQKELIKNTSSKGLSFSLKLEDVIADYNQNAFFQNSIGSDTIVNLIKNLNPNPVWTSSLKRKRGNFEFFETPLILKNLLLIENYDKVNGSNRSALTHNDVWQYIRLISIRNTSGQIESKYVIISPESNFKKNDEEAVQKMSFDMPLKGFTGRELCYNLNGVFYKGWEYHKGRIIAEIKSTNRSNLTGLQTREVTLLDCSPIWQSVCSRYGCTYSIIGQNCVELSPSNNYTTSDPFAIYTMTSGGSSSSGGSSTDGMSPAIVGKCITPLQKLCTNSIKIENNNGNAIIRMKDVHIGVRDGNGKVLSFPMPYVKISTTSMPAGGLDPLIKNAIRETFDKIVTDLQDQVDQNGVLLSGFKPGLPLFDLGNGSFGTMGDYFQFAFDGLYKSYIQSWLQSTGINAAYNATVIRRETASDNYVYTPIVADSDCN